MLRVTVMGNLGGDAELRYSANDRQITSFRIAVNQVRSNASGQREESTEWFRINVAGRQTEYASRLQKGQRVLVDGRLQITHFRRRDGTSGVGFDVWADEVQNVSSRSATEPMDSEDEHAAIGAAAGDVAEEALETAEDALPF
jgi:single-strand DNA-binding protein